MIILALLLITFSCTWSSVFPLYFRPDAVVLQGIDGTLYEFGSDVPSSGDWLTFNPYQRPDAVVFQEIDGTLYEFGSEVPSSGDWLTFYPYKRYLSTKHRSKRQTDWGVSASLSIPLGGGASKPSWGVGAFAAQSDPTFNSRVDAGLRGNFGETPSWSLSGQLESTGTNNHFRGTGQIGGQFGNTPDWSLGGVFSRREGDWTGRLGGGLNSHGGSTIGVGLERGGLGGHIDATNGRVSVGPGSVPNIDPSAGYSSNYR